MIVMQRKCPAFDALKAKFDEAGVEFLMINPMGRLNRQAVQDKVAEYGVDIPVLMDDARLISQALGVARVGEVLLFDPKRFTVEFRGSVAAAEGAIEQILAGEEVSPALVETSGMAVSLRLRKVCLPMWQILHRYWLSNVQLVIAKVE